MDNYRNPAKARAGNSRALSRRWTGRVCTSAALHRGLFHADDAGKTDKGKNPDTIRRGAAEKARSGWSASATAEPMETDARQAASAATGRRQRMGKSSWERGFGSFQGLVAGPGLRFNL
jgi:hypothetical protein